MRALTVQQPWAWAIVHGGKDVENRTQAWGYRGPLAIHAGARISQRGVESPLIYVAAKQVSPELPPVLPSLGRYWRHEESLPLGAVIGVVDLVDVHTADVYAGCCHSEWAESSYAEHGGRTRREVVHLVLEHPRPLAEPIPARGRLSLWTPDDQLLAQIREQVPA